MSAQVPTSSLTTEQLLRLSLFNRPLADALDAALGSGGGGSGATIKLYVATGSETGTGFTLTFDNAQVDTNYGVSFYGAEGDIIVPVAWSVKNKTTTNCTVTFAGDGLTAGGLYMFEIERISATGPGYTRKLIGVFGQSNAVGYGDIASVTTVSGFGSAYAPVKLAQKLGTMDGSFVWETAADGVLMPRTPDAEVPHDFGVELAMGHLLAATGQSFDVVKCAVGASSLQGDWLGLGNFGYDAIAFAQSKEIAFASAMSAIVWIQGEQDAANPTYATNYEANLTAMIAQFRVAWPAIPFIIVKLSSSNSYTYKNTVRTAQVNVDTNVAGTTLVDVDDLVNDGLHFSANAYITMGKRCALAILGQLGITAPTDPDPEITGPTVHTNKSAYAIGEDITITWTGLALPLDWINMVFYNSASNYTGVFFYSNGSTTPPGAVTANGSHTITGGFGSNATLKVRLLQNDGFTQLAVTPNFTIGTG